MERGRPWPRIRNGRRVERINPLSAARTRLSALHSVFRRFGNGLNLVVAAVRLTYVRPVYNINSLRFHETSANRCSYYEEINGPAGSARTYHAAVGSRRPKG